MALKIDAESGYYPKVKDPHAYMNASNIPFLCANIQLYHEG